MNEYAVKKMSEYPTNPSPEPEDLIPTITRDGEGKLVNRNIEYQLLKGDQGNDGAQGPTGPQGDPGQAASVVVGTTETVAPGEDAEVTNSGDSINAVFDFKIPEGVKGDKGDKGDPGVVQSVNGQAVEDVVLDATDVGADPTGSAAQALQDAKDYTDAEVSAIDFPVDSVNGQTDAVVLDTDDITDTATNRYTNDTDITRLANTSGTNTGDQDLSGLATDSELTTGLATKEPTITAGTTSQYYRGDKTWQPTLDLPVSTATQTALDGKATKLNIAQYQVPVRTSSGIGEANTGFVVTENATANTVAYRTTGGVMAVGTPTANGHATTKSYVDTADALKVNKGGDTMTGVLINSLSTGLGYQQNRGSSSWQWGVTSTADFGVWNNVAGILPFYVAPNAPAIGLGVLSNGLNIGAIRYHYGTGFPNGVVSAPVGSIYIDTAVTNGASSWIKRSGTGNTGWQVLEGDTGWRDLSYWGTDGVVNGEPLRTGSAPASGVAGAVSVMRNGSLVRWRIRGVTFSTNKVGFSIPAGFGIGTSYARFSVVVGSVQDYAEVGTNSVFLGASGQTISGTYGLDISYSSPQTWPTTLPGTAV